MVPFLEGGGVVGVVFRLELTFSWKNLHGALPRLERNSAGLDQQLESQFTNSVIRAGKNDRVRARERTHDKAGVALSHGYFHG